jgi:hypothetical protein
VLQYDLQASDFDGGALRAFGSSTASVCTASALPDAGARQLCLPRDVDVTSDSSWLFVSDFNDHRVVGFAGPLGGEPYFDIVVDGRTRLAYAARRRVRQPRTDLG